MNPLARSVWIAPAASTAVAPSGTGQARTSSGPGGQERDQAQQPVGQARSPGRARTRRCPSSSMNAAASSGSSSPSSISIRADSASTITWSMVVAGRDPLDQGRRRGDLRLADVEQDQDRLLGQEPEPPDPLLLVRIERQVADRRPGLQPFVDPAQDDLLALGGLALGRACRAGRCPAAARAAARSWTGRPAGTRGRAARCRGRDRRCRPGCGFAGSSNARTTWSRASESRRRARWSAGSSSVPTWPSVDGGGAGMST